MKRKLIFIYEDYLKVIQRFNFSIDNTSKQIAKDFDIKLNKVDYYIDFYLSQKRNYMGGEVEAPSSTMIYKDINNNGTIKKGNRIESDYEFSIYEGDDLVGIFDTIQAGCDYLGLSSWHIYDHFKTKGRVTFFSRKLQRRLTFIKKEFK